MSTRITTLSFRKLKPASDKASRAARGSSKKSGTKCELVLRRALWAEGLRYRLDSGGLPGRPDILFPARRLVVFCDGDFWHGRELDDRVARLATGHNAGYWVEKIRGNVRRDRDNTARLQEVGWRVLRFWESEILRDTRGVVAQIKAALKYAQPERRGGV